MAGILVLIPLLFLSVLPTKWSNLCSSQTSLDRSFKSLSTKERKILVESGYTDAANSYLAKNSVFASDQNMYYLYTKVLKKRGFPQLMKFLTSQMTHKARVFLPYFVNCFDDHAFFGQKQSILQEYVLPMESYIANQSPSLSLLVSKIRQAFQSLEVIFRNGFYYKFLDKDQIGVSNFQVNEKEEFLNLRIFAENEESDLFRRGRIRYQSKLGREREELKTSQYWEEETSLPESQTEISQMIDVNLNYYSQNDKHSSLAPMSQRQTTASLLIPLSQTQDYHRLPQTEMQIPNLLLQEERHERNHSLIPERSESFNIFNLFRGKVRYLENVSVTCSAKRFRGLSVYLATFQSVRHIYGKASHLPIYDYKFCVKANVYEFVKAMESFLQPKEDGIFSFIRVLSEIEKTVLIFEYLMRRKSASLVATSGSRESSSKSFEFKSVYNTYPIRSSMYHDLVLDYIMQSIRGSKGVACESGIADFFLRFHFYRQLILEILSAFHLMKTKFLRRSLILLLTDLDAFLNGRPLVINQKGRFLKEEVNRYAYYKYEKEYKRLDPDQIVDNVLKSKYRQIQRIIDENMSPMSSDEIIDLFFGSDKEEHSRSQKSNTLSNLWSNESQLREGSLTFPHKRVDFRDTEYTMLNSARTQKDESSPKSGLRASKFLSEDPQFFTKILKHNLLVDTNPNLVNSDFWGDDSSVMSEMSAKSPLLKKSKSKKRKKNDLEKREHVWRNVPLQRVNSDIPKRTTYMDSRRRVSMHLLV